MITTQSKTASTFETRVYDASRLPSIKPQELIEIITTSIEPDLWTTRNPAARDNAQPQRTYTGPEEVKEVKGDPQTAGGNRRLLQGSAVTTGNAIVIRQTNRIHEQIIDLLDQLDRQANERLNGTAK